MKTNTLAHFIQETPQIPASLIRATVRQLYGWNEETQNAFKDITNHGIDGGFGGFIYYVDTVKFFKANKKNILAMAEEQASEYMDKGQGLLDMFATFRCIKDLDMGQNELAKAIYTGKGECIDQVFNCLAWYAGEEVARAYCDYLENIKGEG